jgi:hypothetical protein
MQSNKNTVLNQQEIKDINFSQYKYYEIQQHTRNNWQYATCKINRLFNHNVIKLERANPGASIKDRIALAMIRCRRKKGYKKKVEPSLKLLQEIRNWTSNGSGSKGYTLILVMPESMSIERRRLMSLYGAEFVLTPAKRNERCFRKAKELVSEILILGLRYNLKILPILKFIKNNRIRNYKSISRRFRLYDYWRRELEVILRVVLLKQHYPNLSICSRT